MKSTQFINKQQFIPKALIDSNIWICLKDPTNSYFEKVQSIITAFKNGGIGEVYITNYVLLEVTNFLLSRNAFKTALEMYNFLMEQTNVIFIDEHIQWRIKVFYERYKSLSLTDCSLLVLAEDYKIGCIFSLDSGFDKTSIVRKESFS